MRPINVIRLFLLIGAIGWIVFAVRQRGRITVQRRIIGGIAGGLVGFLLPVCLAALYVAAGGDQTAAGVFSFFAILTVPAGIAAGVSLASKK